MIEAHGLSDIGPVRKTNEDGFFSDPALQLLVVADGMGGHAAGEVASSLAVDTIAGFIRRTEGDEELSWPYGIEPNLSLSGNRLRTAAHLANRRVFREAERHDEYTGMGTTMVGALISGAALRWRTPATAASTCWPMASSPSSRATTPGPQRCLPRRGSPILLRLRRPRSATC